MEPDKEVQNGIDPIGRRCQEEGQKHHAGVSLAMTPGTKQHRGDDNAKRGLGGDG